MIIQTLKWVGLNNETKHETKEEMSMKKLSKWVMIVAVISMVSLISGQAFAGSPSAASQGNKGAWTWGVSEGALVDFTTSAAMGTEEGTITKIGKVSGAPSYLRYTLKTDSGSTYSVYVGPKWFIDNQKIKFAVKDKVEVRGKKWGSNIIATEISKGDWTMKLRNEEDGSAAWDCCVPREKKD
jgi:hypothetical protein